ncbi:hypothetical protein J6590_014107 [Homalodisca vitripennis]|nr:hypothetical protein J6590_014107 [Homalodisca vitripennis]
MFTGGGTLADSRLPTIGRGVACSVRRFCRQYRKGILIEYDRKQFKVTQEPRLVVTTWPHHRRAAAVVCRLANDSIPNKGLFGVWGGSVLTLIISSALSSCCHHPSVESRLRPTPTLSTAQATREQKLRPP